MIGEGQIGAIAPDEHEYHYNPRAAVPDFAVYAARRQAANEAGLRSDNREKDLVYGDRERGQLDVYYATRSPGTAPHVHVFFHGGYWRAQDKDGYAFTTSQLTSNGITVVVPNYELCPAATLDEVVDSALTAFEWIVGHLPLRDGAAISLSGHSAGAHLCAAIMASKRCMDLLGPDRLSGSVLISGIFDPAPAIATTLNAQLHLDSAIAARHDMTRAVPRTGCPTWLFAGGKEPWRWIDQTFGYSQHLRRHGTDCDVRVTPGFNHFSILEQYMDAESDIVRAILQAAGGDDGRAR